jgi:acyl-coenzyme A synthetase/AMP-(fatty) acid ligase
MLCRILYFVLQVAPAELEALMLTHPSVQDVAVIGIPDEQAGELALAFVVRQPGSKLTEKEVVDFVAGKINILNKNNVVNVRRMITNFCIPGQVSPSKRLYGGAKFIAAIPKTASGKILRRDLRELIKGKSKL